MKSEIEAKFLNLDHDEVRAKLREIGATLEHPMRVMKRVMFDYPDGRLQKDNFGRVRVRDEGDKITFTYKSGGEGEYSKEIETTVGSYDKTIELLEAIQLDAFSTHVNKRETWKYKGVEIVLDVWPWLNPYIEIEGPTEAEIKECAADLGFSWEDALFGNIDVAYRRQYPKMTASETVGEIAELNFDTPLPNWLKKRQ